MTAFIWKWSNSNDSLWAGHRHAGASPVASPGRLQHVTALSCLRRMVSGHHTRSRVAANRGLGRFVRALGSSAIHDDWLGNAGGLADRLFQLLLTLFKRFLALWASSTFSAA